MSSSNPNAHARRGHDLTEPHHHTTTAARVKSGVLTIGGALWAADDLYRQITTLAPISETWR